MTHDFLPGKDFWDNPAAAFLQEGIEFNYMLFFFSMTAETFVYNWDYLELAVLEKQWNRLTTFFQGL